MQKKKFTHRISFSGLAVDINFYLLSNIIGAACVIFTGKMISIEHYEPFRGAELDISKLINKTNKKISLNNTKKDDKQKSNKEEKQKDKEEKKQIKNENEQKEKYYYLREEDRIYTALKFKERKGFFRRVLPASWFLTFIFYGVVAFIVFTIFAILIPNETHIAIMIIGPIVFWVVVPITLWVIGIKKRLKYLKEKKKWKECTNSGEKSIELVFKEFQEMEKKYNVQEEKADIEENKNTEA